MAVGRVVRWAGLAEDVASSIIRPLIGDAHRVRAVASVSDLDLAWLQWLPATSEVHVALLDDRGPADPRTLSRDLAMRLLDHATEVDPSRTDVAELVRLLTAGRARLTTARPTLRGAPVGTIEVSGADATTIVLRQPFELESGPFVRCHVFSSGRDDHHLAELVAELDVLLRPDHDDGPSRAEAEPRDGGSTRLRDYQRAAIDAWTHAGGRGILAMATGTGKTETALVAANELAEASDGLVTVILAPFTHLVDQWVERCGSDGERAVACHSSSAVWSPRANEEVDLVRAGVRRRATLVATYATAGLPPFQQLVRGLPRGKFLLVADEVHNLGSAGSAALLFDNADRRLGLTATPERWGDPDGNRRLNDYFGTTVFEYSLSDAIEGGVLAPYRYEISDYELSDDELDAFREASDEYALLLKPERSADPRAVETARLRRSEALDGATGKLDVLRRLLRQQRPDRTIVYCSDRGQLDAVLALSWNEGHQAHPFTGEEPSGERRRILDRFASGDIPLLGAIRCLDEGVDIPEAREAYLLRSSGNPAQYIQRRGRLLRRSPGKEMALIHDLIAVNGPGVVAEIEGARVREFAAAALNGDEALDHARRLLRRSA